MAKRTRQDPFAGLQGVGGANPRPRPAWACNRRAATDLERFAKSARLNSSPKTFSAWPPNAILSRQPQAKIGACKTSF